MVDVASLDQYSAGDEGGPPNRERQLVETRTLDVPRLRLVRACSRCAAADAVVGVSKLVSGDVDRVVVGGEDQVVFERLGAVVIGRLAIADADIRKLRAEEIEIGSLNVRELEVAGQRWPESPPPSTAG